jgi:hypothetical protein
MVERIVPKIAKLWEDKHKIMHIEYFSKVEVTDEDAIVYTNTCIAMASEDNEKKLTLVDFRNVSNFSPGVFSKLTGPELTKLTRAAAVLLNKNTPLVSVGIAFLVKLGNKSFPIKIFYEEKDAIDWLKKFNTKK